METKTETLLKEIVKHRNNGVYLNGTFCPVNYHVGHNSFYVAFSGKVLKCRRKELIALLTEEASRIERYSKLLAGGVK